MDKYIAKFEVHQQTKEDKKSQVGQNNSEIMQSQPNQKQVNQPYETSPQKIGQQNQQSNTIKLNFVQSQINENHFLNPSVFNNNLVGGNGYKIQSDVEENEYTEDNSDAFSSVSMKSEFDQMKGDDQFKQIRVGSDQSNSDLIGQSSRKQKDLKDNQSLYMELNQIYFEMKMQQADEVNLQQVLDIYSNLEDKQIFNASVMITFLNQYYQDTYNSMSDNGCSYMNVQCSKIIKVIQEDNKEEGSLRIPIVRALQSLEGGYEDLLSYFNVISFTKYNYSITKNEQLQKVSFYIIEVDISLNTLYNILRLFNNKIIDETLMQRIFSGLVDIVLQMHARYEVVNKLNLHSIYIHQTNIFLIDFFGDSFQFESPIELNLDYIPQGDLVVSRKDKIDYFKKDIFSLAKCLLSIEMINNGYQFQVIEQTLFINSEKIPPQNNQEVSQHNSNDSNQNSLIQLAKKHNCNNYLLKTKKFIAIEEGQIVLYEVQNILEEMLQEDPKKRLSSIKLAMVCQKTNLLMRDIIYQYTNEFPPTFELDQENNKKILIFPFKPIKQIQDIENRATIIKNGYAIFNGSVDILKKPVDICQVQIFQQFIFEGFFIQGFPYLKGSLKFKNNNIIDGDCYNFIFKQWLIKNKVLEEVIIKNLFQICKWKRGKLMNIELQNIILAGGNKKIIKLNNSYTMDKQTFESVQQLVDNIEIININCIDVRSFNSRQSLEILSNVRYLIISIENDNKAKFLIKFLKSQYCSNLEVLDLSNSNKLDYKDYEINKILNTNSGQFQHLNSIIINNCKSTAPYQFISIIMNSEIFKKILALHIDDTYVDQNLFNKMFESPYIQNLQILSLDDTSGLTDFSVVQLSERLSKFKNLKSLNISGLLKKNFNKNLFTDSNIAAFKKLASQMNQLIFLEVLILDDCYINDSVLENMAKSTMPSLIKIYLRKQQKVTYKGINYFLTSQNFRNLKLINCNSSHSVTLPKNTTSHIELSVMNCKSITSSNISEYLRTNLNVMSIRMDAKHISSDLITSINLTKYLKKMALFISESSDIPKVIMMFKSLDFVKKIQFSIYFHLSKSFIVESDYEFLGKNQFKRNKPSVGTSLQMIEEFKNELKKSIDTKHISDKIFDNLIIHRQSFISFFNEQNFIESTDISSFISLPLQNKDEQQNIAHSSFRSDSTVEDDSIPLRKRIESTPSVLPSDQMIKPIDTIHLSSANDLQENHLNEELKRKFQASNSGFNKIQYFEDLQNFLNSPQLLKNQNIINLSPFSIGSDEINLLTFSPHLNKVDTLILQNSLMRSSDLKLLSLKSISLMNLQHIDLSNNKHSIVNGIIKLIKSECLPKLNSIKLGQYKIKILLKNITQHFRRVTVPLTLVSNFPKFNTDNKVKIMVQNNANNKKYLETLDFYVKQIQFLLNCTKLNLISFYRRGDYIPQNEFGHLKVLMNSFITFYVRKQEIQNIIQINIIITAFNSFSFITILLIMIYKNEIQYRILQQKFLFKYFKLQYMQVYIQFKEIIISQEI